MKKEIKKLDIIRTPLNPGKHLIEASAGTGKTYAISNIFLRLILEKELPPSNILVVTFTVAATAELRDRLRRNLKAAYRYVLDPNCKTDLEVKGIIEDNLKIKSKPKVLEIIHSALLDFDEAAIFTIHSFCQRMLAENAFESGSMFDVEFINSQDELIEEVIDDYWRKYFYNSPVLSNIIKSAKTTIGELRTSADFIIKNPGITFLTKHKSEKSMDELCDDINRTTDSLIDFWNINSEIIQRELANLQLDEAGGKGFNELLTSFNKSLQVDMNYSNDLYLIRGFTEEAIVERCSNNEKLNPDSSLKAFADLCLELNIYFEQFPILFKYKLFEEFKTGVELKTKKEKLGVMTFADMLMDMREGLRLNNGEISPDSLLAKKVRKLYKAALIDEFQDTDPIQYEIFNTIFAHKNSIMFMIGDPKQSIYRFRGADIFAYLKVKKDKNVTEYTIDNNYRTVKPLVDAVDHWFKNETAPNSFVYKEIDYLGVKAADINKLKYLENLDEFSSNEPHIFNRFSASNKDLGQETVISHVASEIVELLNNANQGKLNIIKTDSTGKTIEKRKVKPSDIAVLIRKNDQAAVMKNALLKLNVPSVIQSSGNIFKTDEAKDMLNILDAIISKSNPRKIKSILLSRFIGLSAKEVLLFDKAEYSSRFEYWFETFLEFNKLWEDKTFIGMFLKFLDFEVTDSDEKKNKDRKNVRNNILSFKNGERSLTNILHLAELIHEEERKFKLCPEAVIQWLFDKINSDESKISQDEYIIRLDTDSEAVVISTVHLSKGLEYPIVFCPFLWTKGIEPLKDNGIRNYSFHKDDGLFYDMDSPDSSLGEIQKENMAEEVRLMYVAMTRAVFKLYTYFVDITRGKSTNKTAIYYLMSSMAKGDLDLKENELLAARLKEIDVDTDELNLINTSYNRELNFNNKYIPPGNIEEKARIEKTELKLLYPEKMIRDWGVMSYSALIQSSHIKDNQTDKKFDDDVQNDTVYETKNEQIKRKLAQYPETSFFHFPRMGRFTGLFCHEILENFQFNSILDPDWKNNKKLKVLIESKLKKYGLIKSETKEYETLLNIRFEQVFDMLEKILFTPLPEVHENFSLKHLKTDKYVPEIEFYYPAGKLINEPKLNEMFSKFAFSKQKKINNLKMILNDSRINFNNQYPKRNGFITGSIDLTFIHNGKFYIADWKASWFGPEYNDYSKEKMLKNMSESGYFLQHNLYALALHNFINLKVNKYRDETEKYFDDYYGGIYYFYIRGMNGKTPEYGYIFDKPGYELIKKFSELTK